MQQPIYLYREDETVRVEGSIQFSCTETFFKDCGKLGIRGKELLSKFVKMKVFLIMKQDADKPFYSILTESAIFSCVITEQRTFLITRAFAKTPSTQTQFIRRSVKLFASGGAYITYVFMGSKMEWGVPPKLNEVAAARNAMNEIEQMIQTQQSEDEAISGELESLLDTAEQYVIAEDEIERSNAQSGNLISYARFETESDYSRVDKLSLAFLIFELTSKLYKRGTRITVTLANEETITGAITAMSEDEEPTRMTVLFDALFDISQLPERGVIGLAYQDTQRQVREAVIQSIRSYGSPAAYFDEVIGKNHSSKVAPVDTSELEKELRSRKNPPNESQIDAIVRGIRTEDALLVLGPPGTGKTTVILEWVKHFVRNEGKRVLISSQNNKAVDNVLERLSMESGIETIRVGSEVNVQANIQPLMFENKAYELQQNITSKSSAYMEKLLHDDKLLKHYVEIVQLAGSVLTAFETVDVKLQTMYDTIRNEKYLPLQQLYEAYENLTRDLQGVTAVAFKLARQIAVSEQSGSFMQWLTSPIRYFRKKKLEKLHLQHGQIRDWRARAMTNYNFLYHELIVDLSSDELSNSKRDWQLLSESWEAHLQQVREEWPEVQSMIPPLKRTFGSDNVSKRDIEAVIGQCEARLLQIGSSRRALQRWLGHLESKRNYVLAQVLLDSVDLVGATCIGINSQQRFNDLNFDVTIIDEAGQIQIHNAIVPMSRSPKVIMLGDHLQIPPIVNDRVKERCEEDGTDTELLSTSFFEYLYTRMHEEDKILLDTQYRMPAEIADLLSEWFYEGKYRSFAGKRGLTTVLPELLASPFAVIDTTEAKARRESAASGGGYTNRHESEIVIQLLRRILSTINPATLEEGSKLYVPGGRLFLPAEIGIITPYNAQVKFIRDDIAKHFPELSKREIASLVASLDSFQGQERPIILYSCTRSNTLAPNKKRIGFLNELRRLNVAMSRCQQQLIFIGDIDFLQSCEYEEMDDYGFQPMDDDGNPMPGASEKQFSAFIKLMVRHIEAGHGQRLSSTTLEQKLTDLERGAV
ncbi:MAG: AAA domain-containing protein [Candidatus Cohnella colombiensis]|uniref:AAA domain-containing protein n=1 Tax=Candidatus Cohnella colombiensis TaxID=3121368 RepID=A0AA95JFF8_9BACL|nr:MAG: AAA domain-containing protein [Cohnella sp.]